MASDSRRETRRNMVAGAARLLARRGLQETSFSEVLDLTGAPRGSIYHHFPDGKDQMIADAIDLTGAHSIELINAAAGRSAQDVTEHFLAMWREVLSRSNFQAGCAAVAVTVATDSSELLEHTARVFRAWRQRLAELLQDGGLSRRDAHQFAAMLVAAAEGAVVISRAEQSMEPFTLVARQLTADINRLIAAGQQPSG